MADALTLRGLHVTQVEMLPEVLPTVDPELGALVRAELRPRGGRPDRHHRHRASAGPRRGASGRLQVDGAAATASPISGDVDLVLVVVGVRPDTACPSRPAPAPGRGAPSPWTGHMRTGLPDVYAAGDCVVTHHRLLGDTYLPLGTTAHKQGRVAGENALGGHRDSPAASAPRW